MTTNKSPGGSIYPYYYKGGEIHCLKYGSFYNDTDALIKLIHAEEEFIKANNKRLKIWVDFYKTNLNMKVLSAFVKNMDCLREHISRLAIVGAPPLAKWRLRRIMKKIHFTMPVMFYSDPEDAKTWLVGE